VQLLKLAARALEDRRHTRGSAVLGLGGLELGPMPCVVEQAPRLTTGIGQRSGALVECLLRIGAQLRRVLLGGPAQLDGRGLRVGHDARGTSLGVALRLIGCGARLVEQRARLLARFADDAVGTRSRLLPDATRLHPRDFETLDALIVRVLRRDAEAVRLFLGALTDLLRPRLGLADQLRGLDLGVLLPCLDAVRERSQDRRNLGADVVDRTGRVAQLHHLVLEPLLVLDGRAKLVCQRDDMRLVVGLGHAPRLSETRGFHLGLHSKVATHYRRGTR
jgi:hypothetical protein